MPAVPAQEARLADDLEIPRLEHGRRVALAEGRQRRQLVEKSRRHLVEVDPAVRLDLRNHVVHRHVDGVTQAAAEIRKSRGIDLDTGGEGVAAVRGEQIPAPSQGVGDVDPRNGPGGAAGAAAVERHEQGRPVELLRQARGDDAQDAGVPGLVAQHDGALPGEVDLARDEVPSSTAHLRLDLAAAVVRALQHLEQISRLAVVLRHQELDGQLGAAESTGGVETRAQPETHVARIELTVACVAGEGGVHQTTKSRTLGLLEVAETESGKDPVLAAQGDDVGNRPERHQGERVEQELAELGGELSSPGEPLAQRPHQLERDPHSCVVLEAGLPLSRGARVDEGRRSGQLCRQLVVVRDHHVDAELRGQRDLLDRRGTVVHGDDQSHAVLRELSHGLLAQTVSLAQAIRQAKIDGVADETEEIEQQAGGGNTVDVVIPEDQDALAIVHGPLDARDRGLHGGKRLGVGKVLQPRVQEAPGIRRLPDTSLEEESCHDPGARHLPRQAGPPILIDVQDGPPLVGHHEIATAAQRSRSSRSRCSSTGMTLRFER